MALKRRRGCHSPNPVNPMVTASCGSGPDASEPATETRGKERGLVSAAPPDLLARFTLPRLACLNPPSLGPGRSMSGRPQSNKNQQLPKQLQKTHGKPGRKYRLRVSAPLPTPRAALSTEGRRPSEHRRPSGLARHKRWRDCLPILHTG